LYEKKASVKGRRKDSPTQRIKGHKGENVKI